MKGFKVILAAWSCFLFCMQLRAEHQVSLQGIVNIPGHQLAFLQIDHETSAVRVGEHIEGGSRGNNFEAEVLNIDKSNEVVVTRVAGDLYTNSLVASARPASAKSCIHLKNVSFREAMELYGVLTGRTILLHPSVNPDSFSCDAYWSEDSPSKANIAACFTQALEQRGIVSREMVLALSKSSLLPCPRLHHSTPRSHPPRQIKFHPA